MAFDDQSLYQAAAAPPPPPVMTAYYEDTTATSCTMKSPATRIVSGPYSTGPCSPCHHPHLVLSASTATSNSVEVENSITGKYTNIEARYQINTHILGTGHHGSVRECVHRSTGQRYAVKSINKFDPSVKTAGLAREISLLQEMKHRHIIQLVDVCEDAEYVHLVTDLCEGGELFDKICELSSNNDNGSPCFKEDEASRIMYQVLQAMSYMHKRGIVHRDLKPENILFQTTEEDSSIKIIDFGLSRKHFPENGMEPPMKTLLGTSYYIAPEVLRKKYDKNCDLWSLGVIAYILLCGYPPFNGADNDATHRSVLKGRYTFPAEDWSDVSSEAMDFIVRFLQLDPKKRMTLEQALNHPWIVKHNNKAVVAAAKVVGRRKDVVVRSSMVDMVQDQSSVEVVYPTKQEQYHAAAPRPVIGNVSPRVASSTTTSMRNSKIRTSTYSVIDSPPRRRVRVSTFGL